MKAYIGTGKEGLGPSKSPHIMEEDAKQLSEKLKSTKCRNLDVYLDYLPQENHATISHQAVYNAFKLLFN